MMVDDNNVAFLSQQYLICSWATIPLSTAIISLALVPDSDQCRQLIDRNPRIRGGDVGKNVFVALIQGFPKYGRGAQTVHIIVAINSNFVVFLNMRFN